MILVRLKGGIGNQMFQYAAARRLAHVRGVPLKLDLSWFDNCKADTTRPYELHVFAISEHFASEEDINSISKKSKYGCFSLFARLLGRADQLGNNVILEKHFHFDPDILKLPDNVYLDGYWQSEKYFIDIADIIRKEFTNTIQPDENNRRMAEMIRRSEAVSIHIRRGDYVANPLTNQYHGVCSLDYYSTGMEKIASLVTSPHFFVFSDDTEWVKENLRSRYSISFMDFNGPDRPHEDLRLMSLCKHHIIANSSFSWWGAWLNANPDKIVIAPQKWFNREDIDTRDLIPEGWMRL